MTDKHGCQCFIAQPRHSRLRCCLDLPPPDPPAAGIRSLLQSAIWQIHRVIRIRFFVQTERW